MAQTPWSSRVDSLILRGIDLTVSCEFDSALDVFIEVTESCPERVIGTFYQAAALQSKMMDAEMSLWEDEFYTLIGRAIDLGSARIDAGNDDAWNRFYLGSSLTYKGLYQARSGSLVSAFFNARKGAQYLQMSVEMDSTLYDAYLGLGNYKYWSGRFSSIFKWLPWVRDEREEGVRLVQLAVQRGIFSRGMGLNSLGWIEYDRKQFGVALAHFQRGLEMYPRSRFFQWAVADTYYQMALFDRAEKAYDNLLRFIESGWQNDTFNEIVCRYKLMKTTFDADRFASALSQCDEIIGSDLDPRLADRVKKRLKSTKKYRVRCQNEI